MSTALGVRGTGGTFARGGRTWRPGLRRREALLLIMAGLTVAVGALGLGLTQSGRLELAGLPHLAIFAIAVAAAWGIQALAGRRTDQVLLPVVALLGGISLLLMGRLPQDLVRQELLGFSLGLVDLQLLWMVVAIGVMTGLAVLVRSDRWLRLYRYTWGAAGIVLLLLAFVLGDEVNGARLSISIGPVTGQPSELLKVILVIFLAGYLSENRVILAQESTRLGPFRLPPLAYLAPMGALVAIALGVVVVQRDLGAALLYYAVFLLLLYTATRRASYVVLGITLFLAGSAVLAALFPHVRARIDIWLDPFADPRGAGYQVVQALYAFARGGIVGSGLGAGLPPAGDRLPIPAVHTDFPLAALGEELGLAGLLAVLGLYLIVIERGLRIAAASTDTYRALLCAGLAFVIGVQALIIAAGNLKLIPLTGITVPFISYGGSSLLVNGVVVGLLLAFSDRGAELRPPRGRRLGALRGGRG